MLATSREQTQCVLANTRSQWGEDLMLLPYLLRAAGWRPGVFVELGAFDGISLSNTHALEVCYNWTGVLIEGNPENYAALSRSRRRATKVHSAVCDTTAAAGTVNMTVGGKNMAAQIDAMSQVQRDRIWGRGREYNSVRVPCKPLGRLMQAAGTDAAHLLSLDVEGAEERVLKTVDPACFAVVLVELDGTDKARDERIHTMLTAAGLQFQRQLALKQSGVYLRPKRLGTSASCEEIAPCRCGALFHRGGRAAKHPRGAGGGLLRARKSF